jgi:hypothetical protein
VITFLAIPKEHTEVAINEASATPS